MSRPIASTMILVLLAGLSGTVSVDDPPAVDAKTEVERSAKAVELARAEAAHYRLHLVDESKGVPVLHPDALLQWSNPVVGSIHGSVYVWTDRGVPVAIASIYKWFAPNTHLGVELHALSPSLALADRKGQPAWWPGEVNVERKPIPGAPKPAETPLGRLRQLRALAAEFTASETTRANVVRDLRFLPQPIHRYQSTDPEVIDGGLFAFVLGTDPDVILMIEARKAKDGPEWQFAAARMNSLSLKLNHKGREAWTAPLMTWDQPETTTSPTPSSASTPPPEPAPTAPASDGDAKRLPLPSARAEMNRGAEKVPDPFAICHNRAV